MGGRGIVEMWGGVECTVNRVGDRYSDQVRRTGHHERSSDIERIAALGLRKVRYPVLWERIAPNGLESADWSWTDERLERLRAAGIEPIVTLMHHGSGPNHTSLLDPKLPEQLAEFAGAVARRYPFLRLFTPVNEPLTTARFACAYGHWYPHVRDDSAFARALVVQVQAVARSMDAIRAVIPDAQLVQTDDLGKTYATPELAYQAAWENERRWATYDLLLGRATPFTEWMLERGVTQEDLDACVCRLDVAGFNYYITSERFLDDRLERYPNVAVGGNGLHRYVDVEAARVCAESSAGIRVLGREAWERLGVPIAITEAHLGGTREQQLRWLEETYDDVCDLAESGVPVRGYAVWCLFGLVDWCSLVTRDEGVYECGAYDARFIPPKMTAIGAWMRARARGAAFEHPALNAPGWWRTRDRLLYPEHSLSEHAPRVRSLPRDAGEAERTVLIIGSSPLALRFRSECAERSLATSASEPERAWLVVDVDREYGTHVAGRAARMHAQYICARSGGIADDPGMRAFVSDILDRAIDGENGIFHFTDGRDVEAAS